MNPPRLLISLCTYNERKNLAPLINQIQQHAPDGDVLVVDDSSPDGTGELADELADANPRIHVMHRAQKMGLGTALLAAIEFAITHKYDFLLNMDADFSHHPRYIPTLVECMKRADVAIGSRYVPGGGVQGWGAQRKLMSWAINRYARFLLRLPVRDTSGSFRCYRVEKLKELDVPRFRARGYAVLQEILHRCHHVDCRFEELPIVFENRRLGQSKINGREVAAALWIIVRLGVENLFGLRVGKERDLLKRNDQ